MSIKYSTIADVVNRSYNYNSIDLHHIPEHIQTTLRCLLRFLISKNQNKIDSLENKSEQLLSPTISDICEKRLESVIEPLICIDKALREDELLYSTHVLTGDISIMYIYIPEDIKMNRIIYHELYLSGIYTMIYFLPKNMVNMGSDMYKNLWLITDSMVPKIFRDHFSKAAISANYEILKISAVIIFLSQLDLRDTKIKEEIFEYLIKSSSIRLFGPLKFEDVKQKLEAIYKETQCYSVEELLDYGYILAIL